MLGLSVRNFYETNKTNLQLESLHDNADFTKILTNPYTNNPSLPLTGYLKYFPHNRIQILGDVEISFLKDSGSTKKLDIASKISFLLKNFNIPCFVITNNLEPPVELIEEFKKNTIPLFRTKLSTSTFIKETQAILDEELAPRISIHGTLLEVYGLGVVIIGKSGIGKSECALELIKKGHQLVCDDLVNIKRLAGGVLIGFANKVLKHHMEIRGMGIINVNQLFGVSSILDKKNIDLFIEIEEWNAEKQYDRLGNSDMTEIVLDTKVPKVVIPVKPGRNLAVLIELAAMKYGLEKQGYDTIKEMNASLIKHMQGKRQNNEE